MHVRWHLLHVFVAEELTSLQQDQGAAHPTTARFRTLAFEGCLSRPFSHLPRPGALLQRKRQVPRFRPRRHGSFATTIEARVGTYRSDVDLEKDLFPYYVRVRNRKHPNQAFLSHRHEPQTRDRSSRNGKGPSMDRPWTAKMAVFGDGRKEKGRGAVHGRSAIGLRRRLPSGFLCRFRRTVDRVDRSHPTSHHHRQNSLVAMADTNHAPRAFVVPQVEDNAEGWGPCSVPDHLKDLPYAPFNKADKIGRAADFSGATYGKAHYGASWTRKTTKRGAKKKASVADVADVCVGNDVGRDRTEPSRSKRTHRIGVQLRLPRWRRFLQACRQQTRHQTTVWTAQKVPTKVPEERSRSKARHWT